MRRLNFDGLTTSHGPWPRRRMCTTELPIVSRSLSICARDLPFGVGVLPSGL
jgi:hypothetical protein